jgi:hypothetical protein
MLRQYALLSLFLSFFIFISFIYFGATNPPFLGDSHDYHMPIAQYILNGSIFHIPKTQETEQYFPGASESILSLFILLHINVDWYCLLGWVILFFLLRKMGIIFGLGSELSLIYASAFTSTLAILREIPVQGIDIWIACWFVLCIILLENPKKTVPYFLFLGFAFGMLVGTKYTGPFFMIILLLVYGMRLIKMLSLRTILAFLPLFLIFGASWYLRNLIELGDPTYPFTLLFFQGDPRAPGGFETTQYILWKEILKGHGYIIFQALVSEYLIWGFSFIPFLVLFIMNIKKRFNDAKTTRVFWVCLLLVISSFFMYSFKPTKFDFIISNMRYIYPVIFMLMLSLFMMAKKFKLTQEIALLALLNSIVAVSYIFYHPIVIIIYLGLSAILYFKGKIYIERFISMAS